MSVANATVKLSIGDPVDWLCIHVPTEDGRTAVVDFYRHREGFWTVDVSDAVFVDMPEALTATLMLAIREVRDRITGPFSAPDHAGRDVTRAEVGPTQREEMGRG